MIFLFKVTTGCGTCFDFNTKSDNLFIVGSEEGNAYEFSANYINRIPLTKFEAHSMCIYAIRWNKFHEKVFITCSADWSVKMWDNRYREPLLSYDLEAAVADVAWAPYSSTVFAAVTSEGVIWVFDISVNKYQALCCQSILQKKKRKLTHIAFNPIHPILLVSDDK
jgi:dynein intermediate chain 1, axonemal